MDTRHVIPLRTPPPPLPGPRIGAVRYLNTKPLVHGLAAAGVSVRYDLPSRLADQLAVGLLDVALIPIVEVFRHADYRIVSDACIGCRGPVMSVKVFFRTPPARVGSLAVDEGSRTSATLARILLAERYGIRPEIEVLPIGQMVVSAGDDHLAVSVPGALGVRLRTAASAGSCASTRRVIRR